MLDFSLTLNIPIYSVDDLDAVLDYVKQEVKKSTPKKKGRTDLYGKDGALLGSFSLKPVEDMDAAKERIYRITKGYGTDSDISWLEQEVLDSLEASFPDKESLDKFFPKPYFHTESMKVIEKVYAAYGIKDTKKLLDLTCSLSSIVQYWVISKEEEYEKQS